MQHIFFYRLPWNEVVAEWLWIALWIYVGIRIERRRTRKAEAASWKSKEPTLVELETLEDDAGKRF
jgi:hypothetical protein